MTTEERLEQIKETLVEVIVDALTPLVAELVRTDEEVPA